MKKNSNLSEIELRVKDVVSMLIEGKSYVQILELADRWNCTQRTIANYLQRAKQIIIESSRVEMESEAAKLRLRYELLFKLALEASDLRTATKVLELQSKMFGLAEPKENNGNDNEITFIHKFVGRSEGGIPSTRDELDFTDNNEEMDLSI